MESVFLNGGMIGKTLDFATNEYYFQPASSPLTLSYIGVYDGTEQTTTAYTISSVSLGPTGSKRVIGILEILDTNGGTGGFVGITSIVVGSTAANIISNRFIAAQYKREVIFEVTTTDTTATVTVNVATSQLYEAAVAIFNLSSPSAVLYSSGALSKGVTANISYPANSVLIAAAGGVNISTITWTGITETFEMDYRTQEFFSGATASYTTAGTASISYNHTTAGLQSDGSYVVFYEPDVPTNRQNSGIWALQSIADSSYTPKAVEITRSTSLTSQTADASRTLTLYNNIPGNLLFAVVGNRTDTPPSALPGYTVIRSLSVAGTSRSVSVQYKISTEKTESITWTGAFGAFVSLKNARSIGQVASYATTSQYTNSAPIVAISGLNTSGKSAILAGMYVTNGYTSATTPYQILGDFMAYTLNNTAASIAQQSVSFPGLTAYGIGYTIEILP